MKYQRSLIAKRRWGDIDIIVPQIADADGERHRDGSGVAASGSDLLSFCRYYVFLMMLRVLA